MFLPVRSYASQASGDGLAQMGRFQRQDPRVESFGAKVFSSEEATIDGTHYQGATEHNTLVHRKDGDGYGYLDQDTTALYEAALTTTGNGDRILPGARPVIASGRICWPMNNSERVILMSYESKARLQDPQYSCQLVLRMLFALSACTPTTTENPMTGSSNPSDPATVKAQVEELKQALKDLHAFKTETQKPSGPRNGRIKASETWTAAHPKGEEGVNYSVMSQTLETRRHGIVGQRCQDVLGIQRLHHPRRIKPKGPREHPSLCQ